MKRTQRRGLTCALCALAALATSSVRAADDLIKIQGEWRASFVKVGPNKANDAQLKQMKVVIDANTFTLYEVGGKKEVVHFTLYPGKEPHKTIEFRQGSADGKLLYHGIYKIEGKRLELCWGPAGQARPGEFTTNKNNKHRHYILNLSK